MKTKRKAKAVDKVAAQITFHRLRTSAKGMRSIAAWAKRVLRDVEKWRKDGKISKRFTARYYFA